jgi:hypothetical protein
MLSPRCFSRKILEILHNDLARVLLRGLMIIDRTKVHSDRFMAGQWYARGEEMFGYGMRFGLGWPSAKRLK